MFPDRTRPRAPLDATPAPHGMLQACRGSWHTIQTPAGRFRTRRNPLNQYSVLVTRYPRPGTTRNGHSPTRICNDRYPVLDVLYTMHACNSSHKYRVVE